MNTPANINTSPSRYLLRYSLIYTLIAAVDFFTTIIGINHMGLKEANPMLKDGPFGMIAMGIILILTGTCLIYLSLKKHKAIERDNTQSRNHHGFKIWLNKNGRKGWEMLIMLMIAFLLPGLNLLGAWNNLILIFHIPPWHEIFVHSLFPYLNPYERFWMMVIGSLFLLGGIIYYLLFVIWKKKGCLFPTNATHSRNH